jgi:hypothetical protein
MIAELSFQQTVVIELLKALFTALFVAGAAALVVTKYRGKVESLQSDLETRRAAASRELEAERARTLSERELQRADTAKERERTLDLERAQREVRSEFVRRGSALAGTFYVKTQEHWRRKENPTIWGDPDGAALDASYGEWSADCEVMENELEFRYGHESEPVILWHQARDLLTVRYFSLRDSASKGLREHNAKGHQDRLHSGLTADELQNIQLVLRTYHSTMSKLASELATAEVVV